MAIPETPLIPACSRCGGRMITEGRDGDSACFTCGHVVYRVAPLLPEALKGRSRHPSRGGQSLA